MHRARLFPLPFVQPVCKSPSGSARVRHRYSIGRAIVTLTNRAVATLNRMYDAPSSRLSPSLSPLPPSSSSDIALSAAPVASAAQLRLLSCVRKQVAAFVKKTRAWRHPEPTRGISEGLPANALASLLSTVIDGSRTSTSPSPAADPTPPEGPLLAAEWPSITFPASASVSSHPTVVVPLCAERVALPEQLQLVPLTSVLSPSVAATYAEPDSPALLRPELDVLILNSAAPLRAPRIAGSRSEYVRLIGRMLRAGIIEFTGRPRAVNGVFTVAKDAHADRLIIDAQPANRLFIDSPHVALPNPSHLVLMQVPQGTKMYAGKSDLSNFYHHLAMPPWLRPFFALPALTPAELRSLGLTAQLGVGSVFPMCVSLPMGFSHAVYLAQSAHEHVVYASGALRREDNLLRMTSPLLTRQSATHGIVIDDFFLFSLSRALATEQFRRVLTAYRAAGFIVKDSKVVPPTSQTIKIIGFDVCGSDASIQPAADSSSSLVAATLSVLRAGTVTGAGLAHLVGRWTWCLLLRRPALALLQNVYRFIAVARGRRFTVWPTVRRELLQLLGVLPLLRASLDAPLFHRTVASDASELAAGVVSTPLTQPLVDVLWPLCSSRRHAHTQAILHADSAANPLHCLQRYSPDESAHIRAEAAAFDRCYSVTRSCRWSTIISRAWRDVEHINALELRAVLLAAHWVVSHPSAVSRRVLLLVDSTVALYALWKGRSSSYPLLAVLRKINALLLAGGLTLLTGWLPSKVNPADAPSRLLSDHE